MRIKQRIRIMRAVRQLLNRSNEAKGMIMVKTKKSLVCVNGGDLEEFSAVLAACTQADVTEQTKKAVTAVAAWISDKERGNSDEKQHDKQEQECDEKDTHQKGD